MSICGLDCWGAVLKNNQYPYLPNAEVNDKSKNQQTQSKPFPLILNTPSLMQILGPSRGCLISEGWDYMNTYLHVRYAFWEKLLFSQGPRDWVLQFPLLGYLGININMINESMIRLKLFGLNFLHSQGPIINVQLQAARFFPSSIGHTPRSRLDLCLNVTCLGMTSIHSSLNSPDRRPNESVHFGRYQINMDHLVNRTGQGARNCCISSWGKKTFLGETKNILLKAPSSPPIIDNLRNLTF